MGNPENESDFIEHVIRIDASPETVFRLLIDPTEMVKWLGIDAVLDPRPGGIVRINANGVDIIRGEYVEIIPNRKVVFTWGWEGGDGRVAPGSTRVEITLEPDGDGTVLQLRHFGLEGDDRKKHDAGWKHYSGRMRTVAEGGDPGLDPLGTPDTRHG